MTAISMQPHSLLTYSVRYAHSLAYWPSHFEVSCRVPFPRVLSILYSVFDFISVLPVNIVVSKYTLEGDKGMRLIRDTPNSHHNLQVMTIQTSGNPSLWYVPRPPSIGHKDMWILCITCTYISFNIDDVYILKD